MGLTRVLAGAAVARPHVLVAEAVGAFEVRVALERAVLERGWALTDTAADADVLAVVGRPGPRLGSVVDHVWAQLSEPRARASVPTAADVAGALDEARLALLDRAAQQVEGRARTAQERTAPDDDPEDQHDQHDGMSPDGIPLAEGAEDRDGLEMDELHLPMGPVLAHWPAGVVLRVTLHGDVVAAAELEVLDVGEVNDSGGSDEAGSARHRAARLLDAAASVLLLAGLPDDAARARRCRDHCLAGRAGADALQDEVSDLARGVRSRRSLHRILAGPVLTDHRGGRHSLPDHLVDLLDRARTTLTKGSADAPTMIAWDLPDLLAGQELAAVRLWMAALTPDLELRVHPGDHQEARGG